jgi:hypothetical protein
MRLLRASHSQACSAFAMKCRCTAGRPCVKRQGHDPRRPAPEFYFLAGMTIFETVIVSPVISPVNFTV